MLLDSGMTSHNHGSGKRVEFSVQMGNFPIYDCWTKVILKCHPPKTKKNLHPQKNWKRLISGHFCESPLKGDTSLAFFLPGFCSHLQQAEFRTSGCCYNRQTLPARFLGGAWQPLEITGGWVLTSEARDVSCNRKLHKNNVKYTLPSAFGPVTAIRVNNHMETTVSFISA